MSHVILVAIGRDRPGLVDEVSEFIFDRGGNIEDSRMVNLRGQFAMMVLVGGAEDVIERMRKDLDEVMKVTSLRVELRNPEHAIPTAPGDSLPFRMTGTALDQPGLVHRVARLLRGMKVNIESLDTRLTFAPYTGAPMFEMELVVTIPKTTPLDQLRQDVSALCDELNVDWTLDPA